MKIRDDSAPSIERAMRAFKIVVAAAILPALAASAGPQVSNVRAAQRAGTRLVDITYDVAATSAVSVSVAVSTNSGVSYDLPVSSFSGAGYGSGVTPGAGKAIVWDAGADWGGHYSDAMRVKVTADDSIIPPLPPDPSAVAPAPENGVATLLGQSTEFLYSGNNPVQTGVATGTINTLRVAVLRGRVLDTNAAPVSGVVMTVNQHPEYGQTLTRTNGQYDLAVNGGGSLNLNFEKEGYLPVQRTLDVPWQDYVGVDDVVMLPEDPNVTVLSLPSTNMQAAFGSFSVDNDGVRRAVVLVPPGTRAWIFTHAGETQETATLTTRFTEYTVGDNGPNAMPSDLPDSVAYTYCLSMNAAEAQRKLAGRDVLFSTSVYFYVDNFLGMPEGVAVPMGYYDADAGAWVPSRDGIVIRLIGLDGSGLARVSLNTNLTEASAGELAALGFSDAERRMLASLYPAATNGLWRVPIAHFSTYDPNYGVIPANPDTALPPNVNMNNMNNQQVNQSDSPNSAPANYGAVELENQAFAEKIPLAGTPFNLCYNSRNSAGNRTASRITIPVSGDSISPDLKGMDLSVSVAGRGWNYSYAPAVNQQQVFEWDGKDSYGRSLIGEFPATIRVSYRYDGFFQRPGGMSASFGSLSGQALPLAPARNAVVLSQIATVKLRSAAASSVHPSQNMGGWSVDVQHFYDPIKRQLVLGTGETRTAEEMGWNRVISWVAGNGSEGYGGDGGPATNASFHFPEGIAMGADGSLYIADNFNFRIRRIDPDGIIHTAAGNGTAGYSGDGGPATSASIQGCYHAAPAPDGSLYIADTWNHVVRRVGTNGIIHTVAGNGTDGFSGDDGPATAAQLDAPWGVAAARDGTFYIADYFNHRVRRVGPDGIIHTLAGNGTGAYAGDGGPATNASLKAPSDVAIGPDGAIYIADADNYRVRRVGTDGIIRTVAGNGSLGYSGDGGPATSAKIGSMQSIAVSAENVLYIACYDHVRFVDAQGYIGTLAGKYAAGGYSGDNGPSRAAAISNIHGVAVGLDSAVYIADTGNGRIRKVEPMMPGVAMGEIMIASADGRELYMFNMGGRHLRTVNTLTGSNVFSFSYTTNGFLACITNCDGLATRIERTASGAPTAVVSPFNQRTELDLDGDGCLAAVANPAAETVSLSYSNGLLASVQGARGALCTYTVVYDSNGCVTRAQSPDGGSTALGAWSSSNAYRVASTSGLGRVTAVGLEISSVGIQHRYKIFPDGSRMESVAAPDGTETNIAADGTITLSRNAPDPRFGMQSPYAASTVTVKPSGLASTVSVERAAATADGVLALQTAVERTIVNGRARTTVYSSAGRATVMTSFVGRVARHVWDAQGRRVGIEMPGFLPITNVFNGSGQLVLTRAGDRTTSYSYDGNGFLSSVTDPLGRTNRYERDAVGRVTRHYTPDGRMIQYAYDAQGNRTSVTPPGRAAHLFSYSPVDFVTNYLSPGGGSVGAVYNVDRQPIQLNRAGQTLTFGYDGSGKPGTNDLAGNRMVFGYLTNGLLSAMSSTGAVDAFYSYDGGLVTRIAVIGAVTGAVAYTYDNDFRVQSETLNGTEAIAFGYDADGLLTNAGLCRIDRAAASGFIERTALSNVSDLIAFNGHNEITNFTVDTNGYVAFSIACARDVLGRVTNETVHIEGVAVAYSYVYDGAGRLAAMVTNGAGIGTNIYAYDDNGNLTNWVENSEQFSALYDGQDRIERLVRGTSATNLYQYNSAGDLTNKTTGADVTAYNWDGAGNLMSVVLPGGTNISYRVDALGRRVAKYVDGVFTQGFLYGAGQMPVAELDHRTNLVSRFIYAGTNGPLLYIARGDGLYRVIADRLGSPRIVIQAATMSVAQRIDYDVWGRVVYDSNPGFQPFGFAAGLYDQDTHLVKFGARDYDPESRRWTARDPAGFTEGEANLYAYCANDPVNLADTSGLGPNKPNGPNWGVIGTGLLQVGAGIAQTLVGGTGLLGGGWATPAAGALTVTTTSGLNNFCMGIWNVTSGFVTPSEGPVLTGIPGWFPMTRF